MFVAAAIVAALAAHRSAHAGVNTVPDDVPTIQEAIDVAGPGWVRSGPSMP